MTTYSDNFSHRHILPKQYTSMAEREFKVLLSTMSNLSNNTNNTIFVGINGCQGSGKTTLADYLVCQLKEKHKLKAISCSVDDFYLSKEKRLHLAHSTHSLLKTRGVPGTHNIPLLTQTLTNFSEQKVNWQLTQFDKSTDSPKPEAQWPLINNKMDVVFIEGWCWGVPAQAGNDLINPINAFEKEYDLGAKWRNYVNQQIKEFYQNLYNQMDLMVMLKAPSFDCVYQWRLEQEQKLSKTTQNSVMNESDIAQFIQYFQRLTEHAFAVLPDQVDFLFELDKNRQIIRTMIK